MTDQEIYHKKIEYWNSLPLIAKSEDVEAVRRVYYALKALYKKQPIIKWDI